MVIITPIGKDPDERCFFLCKVAILYSNCILHMKDQEYYTLNALAKSGLLPWRNIATVRKYVETYNDIFRPRMRGIGMVDKRYVIARKDVDRFNELFNAGKLKGVTALGKAKERAGEKFVSIVFMADMGKKATNLRKRLEAKGFRVDFVKIGTRREFSAVLSGMTRTHTVKIFLVRVEDGKLVFPEGNDMASTPIRQMHANAGILGSSVILYANEKPARFRKAFSEIGKVDSYNEVIGFKSPSADTKELLEKLGSISKTRSLDGEITRIIRNPSYIKRTK